MRDALLIVQQVDAATGRSRPVPVDALPEPVTAEEAGLMVGSPPPPDRLVNRGNWLAWPHVRWSLTHVDELGPSARIERSRGPVWELPRATPADTGLVLDGLLVEGHHGEVWTLDEMLYRTYTDAFLVVHRGQVVVERYFNGMGPATRHAMFSMTKTVTGVLALMAIEDGAMGLGDLLVDHVPELAGTAWEPVAVEHALDMTDGVRFVEDYSDPDSDIMRYSAAVGFSHPPRNPEVADNIHDALRTFTERDTRSGETFLYKSAATDALAWAVARATGGRWPDQVAERIWQPMGAEHDAAVFLDQRGLAVSCGGMSATAADLARFGLLLGGSGRAGDRQALPAAVADDIARGGEPDPEGLGGYATRAGWSFHRQCWNMDHLMGAFMPMGVHGQRILIHPGRELVVVKLGSHPVTGNVVTDETHASLWQGLLERC